MTARRYFSAIAFCCIAGVAISVSPANAAKGGYGGTGDCYYNSMGGACSDLEGNGYWDVCEANHSEGVKSEYWAYTHCWYHVSG